MAEEKKAKKPAKKTAKKPAAKKPVAKKAAPKKAAPKKAPAKKAAPKKKAPKFSLNVLFSGTPHALEFASQAQLEEAQKVVTRRAREIQLRGGVTRLLPPITIETASGTLRKINVQLPE